jgi:hypothetical protein
VGYLHAKWHHLTTKRVGNERVKMALNLIIYLAKKFERQSEIRHVGLPFDLF